MKTITKIEYVTPVTKVVEVSTESIICVSLEDYHFGSLDEDD